MKNVKLTVEYDGTLFYGWQRQKNDRSVQEEIEKGLSKIMKKNVKINGSGRTDARVHGLRQIANFREEFTIPIERIPVALNSILPDDIAIINAELAEENFHARYDAVGKKYIYKIYNDPYRSPLWRNYAYYVGDELDLDKMIKASKAFIGTHDFIGFMSSGSSVVDTVRTIYDLRIHREGPLITIEIKGNGFLYNMVRIIVGTLVEVGKGKKSVDEMGKIIESRSRKRAGHTAPAQGLYLSHVYY
ncbi:MAG: tRNA pseudouridine(38-40) synthase TruA [Anaeromicrobium sp.]|jgi:tRNA pseudouridine38-40 synthase|uniref:tRNA pseudouridine(38-40) synthase TruA n=1 Tax=Anaeromicrobium sp. TaxID=1929132 RepID=UPI0025CC88E7|nr:tRNA pseudouridine(38-40) synthase TruA [Anaeromicrobium sp.]MCT4594525.1 tRNA pseudouridine(38-40) synthase TruA [Anaeromicrobium sp.]